jgi:DNA-binding NarL/FixJ family response regulator
MLARVVKKVYQDAQVVEARLCAEAARAIERQAFHLSIVDLGLPDGSGIDVIRLLRQGGTDTEIIVATIFDDDQHLFDAMEAGATGYLLKEHSPEQLVAGLEQMRNGTPPISPSVVRRLVAHFHEPRRTVQNNLTPREEEVLKLIAKGLNRKDVAELLCISKYTVSDYIKVIYRKLEVSSRAEATLEAERLGLIRQNR